MGVDFAVERVGLERGRGVQAEVGAGGSVERIFGPEGEQAAQVLRVVPVGNPGDRLPQIMQLGREGAPFPVGQAAVAAASGAAAVVGVIVRGRACGDPRRDLRQRPGAFPVLFDRLGNSPSSRRSGPPPRGDSLFLAYNHFGSRLSKKAP